MQKTSPKTHAAFAAVLAILLAAGAVQGRHLDYLGESETFYRWILQAATNMRLGGTLEYTDTARLTEAQDDEFFARVAALAEEALPEVPTDEGDLNETGEAHGKLIRAARHELDREVWEFARSDDAQDLRETFLEYQRDNMLQSVSAQLSTESIYSAEGEDGYTVGVSSLFFGFRKVAANFLWLEVDKYWHQGQMHRMVPLMKTVVTLDPNFVDAYLLGAWHLAYNIPAKLKYTPEPLKQWNEKYQKRLGLQEEWYYIATDFLKDGIRNNPRDYRVYFDLGYAVYDVKLKDYPNSILYLQEATHHRHDRWVPRRLNMSLMNNGQYEDAIEGWQTYLNQFPEHPVATKFLRVNEAYLHEAFSEEARECARFADAAAENALVRLEDAQASGNAALVEQLKAEIAAAEQTAKEMRDRGELEMVTAQTIWTEIVQAENDPLAQARLLRIEALNLLEEDRGYEAVLALGEARWLVNAIWEEANAMIIDIKQRYDIGLSTSEKLQVEREREAELYRGDTEQETRIYRLDCSYREEQPV